MDETISQRLRDFFDVLKPAKQQFDDYASSKDMEDSLQKQLLLDSLSLASPSQAVLTTANVQNFSTKQLPLPRDEITAFVTKFSKGLRHPDPNPTYQNIISIGQQEASCGGYLTLTLQGEGVSAEPQNNVWQAIVGLTSCTEVPFPVLGNAWHYKGVHQS